MSYFRTIMETAGLLKLAADDIFGLIGASKVRVLRACPNDRLMAIVSVDQVREEWAKFAETDAYAQLLNEANAIGWPRHFRADLTSHDKERLRGKDAPETFGWVLRPCGTYLLDPRMHGRSLRSYEDFLVKEEKQIQGEDRPRYYVWTGDTLVRVSSAVSFMEVLWILHGELNPAELETPARINLY